MQIDDRLEFLPIEQACIAYNSGWQKVDFGSCVILGPDFSVRKMTDEDRHKISRAAEDHDASK